MSITDSAQMQEFLQECSTAFTGDIFQRLVLSKYQGNDTELTRITLRPLVIKEQRLLSFLYEYRTNHVTKNVSLEDALQRFKDWLGVDFFNAHLLTDDWEIQFSIAKQGKLKLKKYRNKNTAIKKTDGAKSVTHDRAKKRFE